MVAPQPAAGWQGRPFARRGALACLLLTVAAFAPKAGAQTVALHGTTLARFATAEEGSRLLGTRDAFVAAMSAYDRAARTGRSGTVSEKDFVEFAAAQALDWEPAEAGKITASVAKIKANIARLRLPFPPEVLLIKTTGHEEAGTPYTRGNAIILPRQILEVAPAELERVITHEIFHVISRHFPELRKALYAIVGFRDCGPLVAPPELAARRITNPDAPDDRYCITLERNSPPSTSSLTYYPVLFAEEDAFDPAAAGTYLDRLKFRLLAVTRENGRWIAQRAGTGLVLQDADSVPEYAAAIGLNTRYIIHPEEILADNFELLVRGGRRVRTPRILEELQRVLAERQN